MTLSWLARAFCMTDLRLKELWWFDANAKTYPYDPAKAKALLAEAGLSEWLRIYVVDAANWYLTTNQSAYSGAARRYRREAEARAGRAKEWMPGW